MNLCTSNVVIFNDYVMQFRKINKFQMHFFDTFLRRPSGKVLELLNELEYKSSCTYQLWIISHAILNNPAQNGNLVDSYAWFYVMVLLECD